MEGKIKYVLGDDEYKKYVFTTEDGSTILVTATARSQAISMLEKDFTTKVFENMNFTISKVDFEITEDGSPISYTEIEEDED